MNKIIISSASKIALGTVQFGQEYGIANTKGKIREKEAFDALQYARDAGIDTLDTAFDYGDSERVIGKFLDGKKDQFNVISKLPSVKRYPNKNVEELLAMTLKMLNRDKIYGYLVHKFSDYLTNDSLWGQMTSLKGKGVIKKIGFSLYYPEEIETLLRKGVDFDIVQVPYSIFDRRFEKYFEALKANHVDVYVRSAFLQGLAFLAPEQLHGPLSRAKDQVKILRKLSRESGMSINDICLKFILSNPYVDKVVMGVDGLDHLKANLMSCELSDQWNGYEHICGDIRIEDEDILIPSKWKQSA